MFFYLGIEMSKSSMLGIWEKMLWLGGRGGGDNCDILVFWEVVVVVFML